MLVPVLALQSHDRKRFVAFRVAAAVLVGVDHSYTVPPTEPTIPIARRNRRGCAPIIRSVGDGET